MTTEISGDQILDRGQVEMQAISEANGAEVEPDPEHDVLAVWPLWLSAGVDRVAAGPKGPPYSSGTDNGR